MPSAMEPRSPEAIALPARAIASRIMGEQALLLHPKADEIKLTNEVGTLVWQLVCERRHTAEQIARAVSEAFEVDGATAEVDVASFLEDLERGGYLEWG